jgi:hypothetical protein
MKTLIHTLVYLSALGISLDTSAQYAIGVKGGANLNTLVQRSHGVTSMRNASDFVSQPVKSIHAGIYGHMPLCKKLHLQSEVFISQRGTRKSEITQAVQLTYVDVPALFLYNVKPWLSLEAGSAFSRLLRARMGNFEGDRIFKRNTFAAQGGFNFHFSSQLALDVKYHHGLTPALEQTFYDTGNAVLARDLYYNRSLMLSLRYTIATFWCGELTTASANN